MLGRSFLNANLESTIQMQQPPLTLAGASSAVDDVTVIMPLYDRIHYFKHYLEEGLLDGMKVQIVCDGSTRSIVNNINDLIERKKDINVYNYLENRGVAYARTQGVQLSRSTYTSFCDDDDFMVGARSFFESSKKAMDENEDILFSVMDDVFAFTEDLQIKQQYSRAMFDGKTGANLLHFLVRTGEMKVLTLGSVFRTAELLPGMPESFFKVSEDYVFLARLCAAFPHKKIKVRSEGHYMRLMQPQSLSARENYSLEKLVMHLVSMVVGAYHLISLGGIDMDSFLNVLLQRGAVLQQAYGKGEGAVEAIIQVIGHRPRVLLNNEGEETLTFLEANRNALPEEFRALAGW